jgi:hypothetical protein
VLVHLVGIRSRFVPTGIECRVGEPVERVDARRTSLLCLLSLSFFKSKERSRKRYLNEDNGPRQRLTLSVFACLDFAGEDDEGGRSCNASVSVSMTALFQDNLALIGNLQNSILVARLEPRSSDKYQAM